MPPSIETPELTTSRQLQAPSPLDSCVSSRRESQTSELNSVPEAGDEQIHPDITSPVRTPKKRAKSRSSITRFLLPTVPSRSTSLVSRRSWFSVFPAESQVASSTPSREPSRFSFADENEAVARLAAAGVRLSTASSIVTPSEPADNLSLSLLLRSTRFQMWLFLEEPFGSLSASFVSILIVLIIFGSIAHGVFVFEKTSMSSVLQDRDSDTKLTKSANEWIDMVFNLIFCVDLVVRLWAFPLRSRFFSQPKNAIDAICILPFLINEALALPVRLPALNFLRWLSAYETYLRLLKLARYFWGWQLLFRAIWDSAKALVIPLYFLILIVVLGSCTLFVFEAAKSEGRGHSETHEVGVEEQECAGGDEFCGIATITNLPDAIHFCTICILSMSTGPFYGMQASSWGGQATVCALMVLGMTFMAMPISIVGNCFAQTWFDQDRIVLLDKLRSRLAAQGSTPADLRDVFDEVDSDGSGAIDLADFQDMIAACHLNISVAKVRRLFRDFDVDGDGVINFSDFSLTIYPELPLEEVNVQFEQSNHDSGSAHMDRQSERSSCTQSRKSQLFGRLQPPRASEGSGRSSCGRASSSVGSCHTVHTIPTRSVKLWGTSKLERPARSRKQPKPTGFSTYESEGNNVTAPTVPATCPLPHVVVSQTSTIPTVRVFSDSRGHMEDESAQRGVTSDLGLNANVQACGEASRSSFRSIRSGMSSYRQDQAENLLRPDGGIGRLEFAFGTMLQRFERRIDNVAQSLTQPIGPPTAFY